MLKLWNQVIIAVNLNKLLPIRPNKSEKNVLILLLHIPLSSLFPFLNVNANFLLFTNWDEAFWAVWTDLINPCEAISNVRKAIFLKFNTLKMWMKENSPRGLSISPLLRAGSVPSGNAVSHPHSPPLGSGCEAWCVGRFPVFKMGRGK